MEVGWGATDPEDFFVSHASIITMRRILPSLSLVPEGEWEPCGTMTSEPEVRWAPRWPTGFEERDVYTTQYWALSLLVTWHFCRVLPIKAHKFQLAFLIRVFYCFSYLKTIPLLYYNSELSPVLSGTRWSINPNANEIFQRMRLYLFLFPWGAWVIFKWHCMTVLNISLERSHEGDMGNKEVRWEQCRLPQPWRRKGGGAWSLALHPTWAMHIKTMQMN